MSSPPPEGVVCQSPTRRSSSCPRLSAVVATVTPVGSPVIVERADFTVRYDGDAIRDHQISVRVLAPALIGLADVFQIANETLNPGEPLLSLNIRATDEGSFAVELSMIVHHAVDV